MGLRIPADLAAWHAWQQGRRPVRRLVRAALRRGAEAPAFVVGRRSDSTPRAVVAFESDSASSLLSLGAPLAALSAEPVAVLVPDSFDRTRLAGDWEWAPWDGSLDRLLPSGGVVLSGGHYLPLGAALNAQASDAQVAFVTVQHGLMTPWAPPLAPGTHLLAWSEEDAAFWASGRQDVTASVVGGQLLWDAAGSRAPHVSRFERPTFLGQLHGAELPRRGMIRAASSFCRETGATYRPHPSETNRASQLQHRLWERQGIDIDRRRIPLARTDQPVVSAFSTGVVEAAARGIPSWVFYPDAPAWLLDFWKRYRMSPWGDAPTPAPAVCDREPAVAIADWVRGRL